MKISLARRPRRPLNRAEAWGCLTANLAIPGTGSLMAGRVAGYFQLVLGVVGLVISMVSGFQCIAWFLQNYEKIQRGAGDPFANLREMWMAIRWPLLGLGIFLLALFWALLSSIQIFFEASDKNNPTPPKIG